MLIATLIFHHFAFTRRLMRHYAERHAISAAAAADFSPRAVDTADAAAFRAVFSSISRRRCAIALPCHITRRRRHIVLLFSPQILRCHCRH